MKLTAILPNILSLLRAALSPIFAMFFLRSSFEDQLLGVVIFSIAAITDTCDGYVARRFQAASSSGAFLDPLADKLLVLTGLICLLQHGVIAWWPIVLIALRDVAVTWIRVRAQRSGKKFTTSWQAKVKTAAQFGAIYLGFVAVLYPIPALRTLAAGVMQLVAVITVYTGLSYIDWWFF